MRLTYDPRHNVAYIGLAERPAEVETLRISEELNIDIAPDGRIYGIELLNANTQLCELDGNRLIFLNEATGEKSELPLSPK